ncbi:3-oxoacyl-ACP synthase [Mucilaginibacter ginkgonis]|uniref:Uncharacterized protein n=1 Tax=Mucilaginibacter ginkgonis TaxID=2682091 RepID=A0A6I4IND7_9SPHI|nr:3-oxoacyl-ACP synthase [Mucilaginibacter ginkgonis]QQL49325.1 hypothetical protein GO620_014275 [Mucilaginibacter ginkgonis]
MKKDAVVFEEMPTSTHEFLASHYKSLGINYPKFYKMDNLSKLGFLAAEVLLSDTNIKFYAAEEVGVILSNANSSLDADIKYWHSAQDVPSPALFVYTLPNIVIGEICIRNGFKGEHAFYVTPEFDQQFIFQQAQYLLKSGRLKACICGWVEVLGDVYEAKVFLVENKT